jgi:hypothetical protein
MVPSSEAFTPGPGVTVAPWMTRGGHAWEQTPVQVTVACLSGVKRYRVRPEASTRTVPSDPTEVARTVPAPEAVVDTLGTGTVGGRLVACPPLAVEEVVALPHAAATSPRASRVAPMASILCRPPSHRGAVVVRDVTVSVPSVWLPSTAWLLGVVSPPPTSGGG